ncbi:flagellar biosynthesis anti-sigma factor FlgM [Hydrogenophaga sp.]|uniref:flagellar biosynthesis anti-sigma factor FlgM n=1 Tax=Hydrogenophaga sp. TaxID=1904254 RepID=UPI0025B7F220|nr:flagellar biosynthesis anti-sigma factor FlgM [Hydrogenophaga sp.]
MKIDSSPDSYIGSVAGGPQKAAATPPASADQANAAAGAGATAPAKAQPGVTVTLSSATQAASTGSAAGGEVFNSEKVEAMKLAISNGTFQVNPEAIADKMLSNAAEMLTSSRG